MTPAAAILVLSVADTMQPPAELGTKPPAVEGASTPPDARPPNVVVPAVHGLAIMTVMRAAESVLWPDPFARPKQFAGRYAEAFTKPPVFDAKKPVMQWDGDPVAVNVFGHALFGSELYLRARQCRFGWAGALAFTAATSAVWEYGFEANGARPSALDLVYTPLAGLALGEARWVLHRAAGGLSSPIARGVVRVLLDPLGEGERATLTDC